MTSFLILIFITWKLRKQKLMFPSLQKATRVPTSFAYEYPGQIEQAVGLKAWALLTSLFLTPHWQEGIRHSKHTVFFSSSYFSTLLPLALIWVLLKGKKQERKRTKNIFFSKKKQTSKLLWGAALLMNGKKAPKTWPTACDITVPHYFFSTINVTGLTKC